MPQEKVGASRHNAKAAPKNNPLSGSKRPEPPSLIVGGGTPDRNIEISEYQEPTTTFKDDFCQNASCGSPWTIHHHPTALKMHIKSWFNYGKYGSIVNIYGPDFCNEAIQEYKNRWTEYKARGVAIERPGGFFKNIVDDLIAGGEPRNHPNDVTQRWAEIKPESAKPGKDKWVKEYERRRGPLKRS
jgi:hypothetical protein